MFVITSEGPEVTVGTVRLREGRGPAWGHTASQS